MDQFTKAETWLHDNVEAPGVNALLRQPWNAITNVVNTVTKTVSGSDLLPRLELEQVKQASMFSTEYYAQGISSGLASAIVYVTAGRIAGRVCQGLGSAIGLEGTAARLIASQHTAQILGAGLYDGMRDTQAGETRLGNALGGAASFSVFEGMNSLTTAKPFISTASRLMTGAVGSAVQVLVSREVSGNGCPTLEDLKDTMLSGSVMNLVLPAVQEKLGLAQDHIQKSGNGNPTTDYTQKQLSSPVEIAAVEHPTLSTQEQSFISNLQRQFQTRLPALTYLADPEIRGYTRSPAINFSPTIDSISNLGSKKGGTVSFSDGSSIQRILDRNIDCLRLPTDLNKARAVFDTGDYGINYHLFPNGDQYYGISCLGKHLRVFADGTIFSLTPDGAKIEYQGKAQEAPTKALLNLATMVQDARKIELIERSHTNSKDVVTPGVQADGCINLFKYASILEALEHIPLGSRVIGTGADAVIFRQPQANTVLRLTTDSTTVYPNIPELIQPVRVIEGETWRIEELPFAQTQGLTIEDALELQRKLKSKGWDFCDCRVENIGIVNGQVVIIDRNAIKKLG